ncbi:hypothetical protein [Streptomyces sp. SYP-A7185]|uniref:hypothetical protein n=1 Tax=Streptomyces sp. SYP-A7185 TaxID=3040076 RepID=UPI0038F75429
MTDTPQRPPRPDEELARFHDGDTLDSIPVVRPSPPPERRRCLRLILLALAVSAVGALAGVGVVSLSEGKGSDGKEQVAAPPARSSTPLSSYSAPSSAPPSSTTRVEQVRIIQTPQTGGDPGADYCLVYTGSFSGTAREAILLMGAPAYQCSELLPFDPSGETPAFTVEVPDCVAPARPAVVTFAEPGGWENELQYTCLTEHNGA